MAAGTSIERFGSGSRRNGETKVESTEHLTYSRDGATAIVTMNRPETKDAVEGPKAFAEKRPARFTRR